MAAREVIAALRCFDGAASVCVWVASETILLARAKRSIKAFITSIYAMSIAVGYGAGSGIAYFAADVLPNERLFLVAGGLTVATAFFVAFKLDRGSDTHREEDGDGVRPPPTERATFGALVRRIKTSCFATFAYGYFQSSVVLFLPLFMVAEKGIEQKETRLITLFFAVGMLLATNFAGRIGDLIQALRVVLDTTTGGAP